MKVGQTSIIVFGSHLTVSVIGFLATLYFARTLGAEVLGSYALAMVVLAWLQLGGNFGISNAMIKRISEGTDRGEFAGSGIIVLTVLGAILSALILVFNDVVNNYVGEQVVGFIVILLILGLGNSAIGAILEGQRHVHVSGLLRPVRAGSRSASQVGLVFSNMGLRGLLIGKGVGLLISMVAGMKYLEVVPSRPDLTHFKRLYDYAKYSWLGTLKSHTQNHVDILMLGFFVPSSLVGVYSVAWTISKFLSTFDKSISQSVFPEISRAHATADDEFISNLVTDSLRYTGLILIPGLIGGTIIGNRLLRMYGQEFVVGTEVLSLLILSTLLFGYQKQLMTTLNAIDRPDITFRINIAFISVNVIANFLLILAIGWVGAAIATVISSGVGLTLAYLALRRHVQFSLPLAELARQGTAVIIMVITVYGGLVILETHQLVDKNVVLVLAIVILGSGSYFSALALISPNFREVILRNLPPSLTRRFY